MGSNYEDDSNFAFSLIAKYDLLSELKQVDQFLAQLYTTRVEGGEIVHQQANKIEQQDWFGPLSNSENGLLLSDFGFCFEDVKFVKTADELEAILPIILKSKLVSFGKA